LATSNPAFSAQYWQTYGQGYSMAPGTTMTVQGTVGKTSLLLAILSATAIWSWTAASNGQLQPIVLPASVIGGFILAMITIFRPTAAPWTAPLYAAFEGVFLGALSFLIEHATIRGVQVGKAYPGIALQAVAMSTGVLFVMLALYGTRTIRVTDKLRTGVIAATGALCLVYFVSFLLTLFGVQVPYLRDASPLGIGISLFVVGLAAFNLLLDFDFIENASRHGAPKSMEWYGAFGLIVTLVWLYLEILRLLRQLQDRRS
jgi:uncharacterized YccA/Bax inhibitor family protein